MSWDETFAEHYDEWSAGMAADVAFYVELARAANGPLVELAIGNGRPDVRARRRLAPTGRPVRVERLRVRPPGRCAPRRRPPRPGR